MEPGAVVAGRFAVEREAASGGMGVVYRALDRVDGTEVALKVLHARGETEVERFEREAGFLAALSHPGIVRYVAHGVTPSGERYLAMEWLEGEDLSARLARRVLTAGESLSVARRAAEALAFAHERGLVHRDIKPSNLFLAGRDVDRLKVVDFGIARPDRDSARLTLTGGILGTPGYMSPEQIEGTGASDPRSDVFSLGCVLFECLTGYPAFAATHPMAALAKLILEEPPRLRDLRPDAPEALEQLVSRMLAKLPTERPNCAEVLAELDRLGPTLDAWMAPPDRPTLSSELSPSPAAPHDRSALTRSEQRLVSLVLIGDPAAARRAETARFPDGGEGRPPVSSRSAAELGAILEPYAGKLTQLGPGAQLVLLAGPGSAVDRVERAAQCALALRAELPGASLCIVTGRGVFSSNLVEGDLIERGVTELRKAPAGVVRLDDVTASMLSAARGAEHGGVRIEVDRRGGAFALSAEASSDESPPALLGKSTPCVGRSRELAMLEGVLSGCLAESLASAVLVLGPPGAGKSRLRLEFVGHVRQRGEPFEILSGRADSGSPGSPFGMIADVLRRASGIVDSDPIEARRRKLKQRLGRHLDAKDLARVAIFLGEIAGVPFPDPAGAVRAARQSALRMADAVRAAWEDWLSAECAAQPVLITLEDLHWGDAATVRLIDATLRNLRELPLMLLVHARPEVHRQFPNLWTDREVQTIKLGPLPRRASEQLVHAALGETVNEDVVARIIERAGGNPFYLEELIRAVASGNEDVLPDSVLGTVEARLDAEGTEAKRVLRAASIFGDRFSKYGVAALLGGEERLKDAEAWLSSLADRELVVPACPRGMLGPADYVFRHALVREAAYAMLTEPDRVLGHRLAGGWLERTGCNDAMVVAEHFRRGGEPSRAVRWYLRAAEQSLEASDLRAALARAAAGAACGAAGEELGAIRLVEAEASVWEGDLVVAEERGAAAVDLLPTGSCAWFRAVTQIAAAAGKLGGVDRVARWAAAATRALDGPHEEGAAPPSSYTVFALRRAWIGCFSECAAHLVFAGRFVEADKLIARIDQELRVCADGSVELTAIARQLRAIRASADGDPGACLEGLQAAFTGFEQAGDRRSACVLCSNLGFIYAELGDFEAAEAALRFAFSTAERMGLRELAAVALHNLGNVLAHRGLLDEARRLEQRAVDTFQQQGDVRMEGVSRTYLAKIALLSGEPEVAEREARAAAVALHVAPPLRAAAVAVLSRALLAQGSVEDALSAATSAYCELEALGSLEEGESLVRLAHVEALFAAGAEREATAALARGKERLLARAAKISDPRWRERFLTAVPDNARTISLGRGRGSRRALGRIAVRGGGHHRESARRGGYGIGNG